MSRQEVAIVERPVTGPIRVYTPFVPGGSRRWLKEVVGFRSQLDWSKEERRWLMSRQHMMPVVNALLKEWGTVELYREYYETQRCDTRCQRAEGPDCECSCMGLSHGTSAPGGGWMKSFELADGHTVIMRGPSTWVRMTIRPARQPRGQ